LKQTFCPGVVEMQKMAFIAFALKPFVFMSELFAPLALFASLVSWLGIRMPDQW